MSNIRLFALAVLLLLPGWAFANQTASGFCTTGGIKVTTFGSPSSNPVQGSYPGCIITVNIHGGALATITDANGGALANPFTASLTTGFWEFAATNGFYDITLSGGTPAMPSPMTIVNLLLNDPGTAAITASSFTGSGFISSTALVATSGIFRCASVDNCLNFRNNGNTLDLAFKKTGAAAGNLPADVLDASAFGGIKVSQFFSNSAQSAVTGVLACAASDTCVAFRNQANSADISGLAKDASDRIIIGGAAGFTASIGNITNGLTVGTGLTVGGASALQGVTANTITASGEIAPSVTGGALGDTAHRFDAFVRNLDISGTATGIVTGNGTTNTIPKFTSTSAVGNSSLTDNGTTVSTSENVSVGGTLITTGATTLSTLTINTSETVTQPTVKTGANQLNQGAGLQIVSIDDWSRLAVFGTGIISGKWSSISGPFPEGNDNPIMATGPADIPLRHIDLDAQCTAAITSGSEQNCPLQLPAPIASTFGATANNSGGTLTGGTTYFIKATWTACTAYTYLASGLQNPNCTLGGETTASPELSVTTPTCAVANTCSITVTFVGYYPTAVPDVYPGVGAYNLYSSSTTGTERLMIANHDIHTVYTMTAVGAGVSPPVSNTAAFPTIILASNHNGIELERGCDTGNNCGGVARTEILQSGTLGALTSGQYAINGSNAIHIFTTKAHPTTPWDVSQLGSTIFHGDNEVFMCDRPLGPGGTGHNPAHIWYDSSNLEIARVPCDTGTGNVYPDWMMVFDTPISGKNGVTKDVVVRSSQSGSFFRVQNFSSGAATGADLFTVNDNGAVIVPAGNFSVPAGQIFGSFNTASANAAIAGTFRMASTDIFGCWRNNANSGNDCLTKNTSDVFLYNGLNVNDGVHASTITIASGTAAMTTAGIATGACGTTVTVAATGVLTTDPINISHNAAVTIGNGGGLTLNAWPTAGNVNFNYCNSAAGTITPTAMTVNWSVTR